jgi:CheY-like chemotaxis protein
MASDRRKFLALMALGLPATTSAMRQGSASTVSGRVPNLEDNEIWFAREDLILGVSDHLLGELFTEDAVSIRVIRRAPSDCQPGKIRWALEIEEPDRTSKSTLDRHPRVLLVCGQNLQIFYGICLERAGCKVESTADINAAMQLYCEHGPYDIVLTDLFHAVGLFKLIRERNPEQAYAMVGSCGATHIRFHDKIPVLRSGFRQRRFVKLVESAIKPRMRVLLVVGDPDVFYLFDPHPESFEIELETNGNEALKRYRERGPYDMVLAQLRLPGLEGSDLALTIRRENPAQRVTMITDSASVRPSIRRKLRDIPVLKLKNLRKVRATDLPKPHNLEDGEAQVLLDRVEAAMALQNRRRKASRGTEA